MIVYHVCSANKLKKYLAAGKILGPVRAWENEQQAARMSKSTGRPIILRLKFPNDAKKLEGHFNQARIIQQDYYLCKELTQPFKKRSKDQ
jgi:hypothetical protein